MPPWLVHNLDAVLSGIGLLVSVVGLAVTVCQVIKGCGRIAGYVRNAIKKMLLLTEATNHESILATLDEQIVPRPQS
jgi:hypothetical protein